MLTSDCVWEVGASARRIAVQNRPAVITYAVQTALSQPGVGDGLKTFLVTASEKAPSEMTDALVKGVTAETVDRLLTILGWVHANMLVPACTGLVIAQANLVENKRNWIVDTLPFAPPDLVAHFISIKPEWANLTLGKDHPIVACLTELTRNPSDKDRINQIFNRLKQNILDNSGLDVDLTPLATIVAPLTNQLDTLLGDQKEMALHWISELQQIQASATFSLSEKGREIQVPHRHLLEMLGGSVTGYFSLQRINPTEYIAYITQFVEYGEGVDMVNRKLGNWTKMAEHLTKVLKQYQTYRDQLDQVVFNPVSIALNGLCVEQNDAETVIKKSFSVPYLIREGKWSFSSLYLKSVARSFRSNLSNNRAHEAASYHETMLDAPVLSDAFYRAKVVQDVVNMYVSAVERLNKTPFQVLPIGGWRPPGESGYEAQPNESILWIYKNKNAQDQSGFLVAIINTADGSEFHLAKTAVAKDGDIPTFSKSNVSPVLLKRIIDETQLRQFLREVGQFTVSRRRTASTALQAREFYEVILSKYGESVSLPSENLLFRSPLRGSNGAFQVIKNLIWCGIVDDPSFSDVRSRDTPFRLFMAMFYLWMGANVTFSDDNPMGNAVIANELKRKIANRVVKIWESKSDRTPDETSVLQFLIAQAYKVGNRLGKLSDAAYQKSVQSNQVVFRPPMSPILPLRRMAENEFRPDPVPDNKPSGDGGNSIQTLGIAEPLDALKDSMKLGFSNAWGAVDAVGRLDRMESALKTNWTALGDFIQNATDDQLVEVVQVLHTFIGTYYSQTVSNPVTELPHPIYQSRRSVTSLALMMLVDQCVRRHSVYRQTLEATPCQLALGKYFPKLQPGLVLSDSTWRTFAQQVFDHQNGLPKRLLEIDYGFYIQFADTVARTRPVITFLESVLTHNPTLATQFATYSTNCNQNWERQAALFGYSGIPLFQTWIKSMVHFYFQTYPSQQPLPNVVMFYSSRTPETWTYYPTIYFSHSAPTFGFASHVQDPPIRTALAYWNQPENQLLLAVRASQDIDTYHQLAMLASNVTSLRGERVLHVLGNLADLENTDHYYLLLQTMCGFGGPHDILPVTRWVDGFNRAYDRIKLMPSRAVSIRRLIEFATIVRGGIAADQLTDGKPLRLLIDTMRTRLIEMARNEPSVASQRLIIMEQLILSYQHQSDFWDASDATHYGQGLTLIESYQSIGLAGVERLPKPGVISGDYCTIVRTKNRLADPLIRKLIQHQDIVGNILTGLVSGALADELRTLRPDNWKVVSRPEWQVSIEQYWLWVNGSFGLEPITGKRYINGRPVSTLPDAYLNHSTYRHYLGNDRFEVAYQPMDDGGQTQAFWVSQGYDKGEYRFQYLDAGPRFTLPHDSGVIQYAGHHYTPHSNLGETLVWSDHISFDEIELINRLLVDVLNLVPHQAMPDIMLCVNTKKTKDGPQYDTSDLLLSVPLGNGYLRVQFDRTDDKQVVGGWAVQLLKWGNTICEIPVLSWGRKPIFGPPTHLKSGIFKKKLVTYRSGILPNEPMLRIQKKCQTQDGVTWLTAVPEWVLAAQLPATIVNSDDTITWDYWMDDRAMVEIKNRGSGDVAFRVSLQYRWVTTPEGGTIYALLMDPSPLTRAVFEFEHPNFCLLEEKPVLKDGKPVHQMTLHLSRYGLQFLKQGDDYRSMEYDGYRIASNQLVRGWEGISFFLKLIPLEFADDDPSVPFKVLLPHVPCFSYDFGDKVENRVLIPDLTQVGTPPTFVYTYSPSQRYYHTESQTAALYLAYIMFLKASLQKSEDTGLNGYEMAAQLLDRCYQNAPYSSAEYQIIDRIVRHQDDHRDAFAIRLRAHNLKITSQGLGIFYKSVDAGAEAIGPDSQPAVGSDDVRPFLNFSKPDGIRVLCQNQTKSITLVNLGVTFEQMADAGGVRYEATVHQQRFRMWQPSHNAHLLGAASRPIPSGLYLAPTGIHHRPSIVIVPFLKYLPYPIADKMAGRPAVADFSSATLPKSYEFKLQPDGTFESPTDRLPRLFLAYLYYITASPNDAQGRGYLPAITLLTDIIATRPNLISDQDGMVLQWIIQHDDPHDKANQLRRLAQQLLMLLPRNAKAVDRIVEVGRQLDYRRYLSLRKIDSRCALRPGELKTVQNALNDQVILAAPDRLVRTVVETFLKTPTQLPMPITLTVNRNLELITNHWRWPEIDFSLLASFVPLFNWIVAIPMDETDQNFRADQLIRYLAFRIFDRPDNAPPAAVFLLRVLGCLLVDRTGIQPLAFDGKDGHYNSQDAEITQAKLIDWLFILNNPPDLAPLLSWISTCKTASDVTDGFRQRLASYSWGASILPHRIASTERQLITHIKARNFFKGLDAQIQAIYARVQQVNLGDLDNAFQQSNLPTDSPELSRQLAYAVWKSVWPTVSHLMPAPTAEVATQSTEPFMKRFAKLVPKPVSQVRREYDAKLRALLPNANPETNLDGWLAACEPTDLVTVTNVNRPTRTTEFPLIRLNKAPKMFNQFYNSIKTSWEAYHSQSYSTYQLTQTPETIRTTLTKRREKLADFSKKLGEWIEFEVNRVPDNLDGWGITIARMMGVETLTQRDVTQMMYRHDQYDNQNPFLIEIKSVLMDALVTFVRAETLVQHIDRCLAQIRVLGSTKNADNQRIQTTNLAIRLAQSRVFTIKSDPNCDGNRQLALFELDNDLLVRPKQYALIKLLADTNLDRLLVQLNMGEGKSSVILLLVILEFAKSKKLARMIVPESLFNEMKALIESRLRPSFGTSVYLFPFHRRLVHSNPALNRLTIPYLNRINEQLTEAKANGHIVLMTPEQRLSLLLLLEEHIHDAMRLRASIDDDLYKRLALLMTIETQIEKDILDEADATFDLYTELNFTLGDRGFVDAIPTRFNVPTRLFGHILNPDNQRTWAPYFTFSGQRIQLKTESHYDDALSRLIATTLISHPAHSDALMATGATVGTMVTWVLGDEPLSSIRLPDTMAQDRRDTCLTLLRVIRCWSHPKLAVFKHVFLSRYQVDYGQMDPAYQSLPEYAAFYRRTAIPFRGKDTPVLQSNFSHPDVLIGFSILNSFYAGARWADIHHCIDQIKKGIYSRESVYAGWISGSTARHPNVPQRFADIDLNDPAHQDALFQTLTKSSQFLFFYLENVVFLHLEEYKQKLTADGISIAAGCNWSGVSGTIDNAPMLPSGVVTQVADRLTQRVWDMPEADVRAVADEIKATDGKLVSLICESGACSIRQDFAPDCVSAEAFLAELVAAIKSQIQRGPDSKQIHALLDRGALMTGMSNQQVAKWLAEKLSGVANVPYLGVLYFDDDSGRKMVALIHPGQSVKTLNIESVSLGPSQLFAYYNDVKTRGTDLVLPSRSIGILTIGPDLKKDDFVQAIMRMRQFGNGQDIVVWIPDDIKQKMTTALGIDSEFSNAHLMTWTVLNSARELADAGPIRDRKVAHAARVKQVLDGVRPRLDTRQDLIGLTGTCAVPAALTLAGGYDQIHPEGPRVTTTDQVQTQVNQRAETQAQEHEQAQEIQQLVYNQREAAIESYDWIQNKLQTDWGDAGNLFYRPYGDGAVGLGFGTRHPNEASPFFELFLSPNVLKVVKDQSVRVLSDGPFRPFHALLEKHDSVSIGGRPRWRCQWMMISGGEADLIVAACKSWPDNTPRALGIHFYGDPSGQYSQWFPERPSTLTDARDPQFKRVAIFMALLNGESGIPTWMSDGLTMTPADANQHVTNWVNGFASDDFVSVRERLAHIRKWRHTTAGYDQSPLQHAIDNKK